MIKAIIFDCFGVLVTSSYEPFKKKYFGDKQELISRFIEIEDRSSRGEISLDEAEIGFAELAGISFQQCAKELMKNPRNVELLEYIRNRLKTHFKIGLLSNVAKDRTQELFSAEDIAAFDDIVLSFRVGIAKPDPEIFKLASSRLGLRPDECLFIDDLEKYLFGARKVGMQTLHYKNFEDFKDQLTYVLNSQI
jgi:epoxide hydrolase-like predicted phosphatase